MFHEWLNKGIKTVKDLLDSEGNVLSFKSKFHLKKTSFLHFCQVISAIPNHLLQRARELINSVDSGICFEDMKSFQIDRTSCLNLTKVKGKDFYWLLVNKIHTNSHTGPKRWEKSTGENISIGPRNCYRKQTARISFQGRS